MNFPDWSGWIMGVIVLALVLWEYFFGEKGLPSPYKTRDCTGSDWKKRFPGISNHDIRLFLTCLVDGMLFKESEKLKFKPEDKVIDIYRSIYGGKTPFSDGMECEIFVDDVAQQFKVDQDSLYSFCQEGTTLGEIFEFVITNGKLPATGQVSPA